MDSQSTSDTGEAYIAIRYISLSPALVLLAALLLAGLGACTSPLDLETRRLDSILVPGMKLQTITTNVFNGNGVVDTSAVINWVSVTDTLYFKVKTGSEPPRVSLYTVMRNDSTVDSAAPIKLKRLLIRLEDLPAVGTYELSGVTTAGHNSVSATLTINNTTYSTNLFSRNFQAQLQLNSITTPTRRVEGKITLSIDTGGGRRLLVISEIVGEA